MSKETNIEILFTLLKGLQKNDVNRHARDNKNNKTTLSKCRHLNAIKELMKQFTENYSLLASKERKG